MHTNLSPTDRKLRPSVSVTLGVLLLAFTLAASTPARGRTDVPTVVADPAVAGTWETGGEGDPLVADFERALEAEEARAVSLPRVTPSPSQLSVAGMDPSRLPPGTVVADPTYDQGADVGPADPLVADVLAAAAASPAPEAELDACPTLGAFLAALPEAPATEAVKRIDWAGADETGTVAVETTAGRTLDAPAEDVRAGVDPLAAAEEQLDVTRAQLEEDSDHPLVDALGPDVVTTTAAAELLVETAVGVTDELTATPKGEVFQTVAEADPAAVALPPTASDAPGLTATTRFTSTGSGGITQETQLAVDGEMTGFRATLAQETSRCGAAYRSALGDAQLFVSPTDVIAFTQRALPDGSVETKELISAAAPNSPTGTVYSWDFSALTDDSRIELDANADGSVSVFDVLAVAGVDVSDVREQERVTRVVEEALGGRAALRERRLLATVSPPVYVTGTGETHAARYAISGTRLTLNLAEPPEAYPLLIDPTYTYHQWLGGSGYDLVTSVASLGGVIYAGGYSNSSASWESATTFGTFGGGMEGFVVRIVDGDVPSLSWLHWLGGSGNDYITSLAVKTGALYVGGYTDSGSSWEAAPTTGTVVGTEGFVVEFYLIGLVQVNWIQFLGGNGTDMVLAVALSDTGEIYAGGTTAGDHKEWEASTTTVGTVVGYEGFVVEITDGNPLPSLAWKYFLGGDSDDTVNALAVTGDEVYAAGTTSSSPASWEASGTTVGAVVGEEGFVVEIADAATPTLPWKHFLGGDVDDFVYAVAVTGDEVYVAGSSGDTTNWETVTFQGTHASDEGFVVEIADGVTPTLVWGQWIGGVDSEQVRALLVENDEIVVGGSTGSATSWETLTFQGTYSGSSEGFVVNVQDGTTPSLTWGQWLGGTGIDSVWSVALTSDSSVVYGGYSTETSFDDNTMNVVMTGGSVSGVEGMVGKVLKGERQGWAQLIGGASADYVNGVAVVGTSVYVAGYTSNTTAWEAVPWYGAYSGSNETFLLKVADGQAPSITWGQWLGGTASDVATGLAANGGELYVVGYTSGATGWEVTPAGTLVGNEGFIAEVVDNGTLPSVSWVQFLGGSGSDLLYAIAVSGDEIYVGGQTGSATGWELVPSGTVVGTEGVLAELVDGASPFVSWVQFLGGDGNDFVYTVAVSGDEIYASGQSASAANWEAAPLWGGALVGLEAFVVELADGTTPSFTWGQWLGGDGTDAIRSMAVSGDSIYVGGFSYSDSAWESVTFQGAYGGVPGTNSEGFVLKLTDNSGAVPTLDWAQWLGGGNNDFVYAIAASESLVVAGGFSLDATSWESMGVRGTHRGGQEGFVVVLEDGATPRAQQLQWVGGTGADQVLALALRPPTGGGTFPGTAYYGGHVNGLIAGDGIDPYGTTSSGQQDGIVGKMDVSVSGTMWGQLIGGDAVDVVNAVAVNGSTVYVAGFSDSAAAWETVPWSGTHSGFLEGFVVKLSGGATPSLTWGQWLGGTGTDSALRIAASGTELFVGGVSTSTASWEPMTFYGSGPSAFVVKVVDGGASPSLAWGQWLTATSMDGLAVDGDRIISVGASGLDGLVSKVTDGTTPTVTWTQALGGTGTDQLSGVSVAGSSIYVVGRSTSPSFAQCTFQGAPAAQESFVVKLTDSGASASVVWCQWLGGGADDYVYSVATSAASPGKVYVGGSTYSPSSWETPAAGFFGTHGSANEGFVAELTDAGASSTIQWVQWLGGGYSAPVRSIVADGYQLYAAGTTQDVTGFEPVPFLNAADNVSGYLVVLQSGSTPTLVRGVRLPQDLYGELAAATNGADVYLGGRLDDAEVPTATPLTGTLGGSYDGLVLRVPIASSIPPGVNGTLSVAGDTTSPFWDTTDDGGSVVFLATTSGVAACRWSTTDQSYSSMPNACSPASKCELAPTGQGAKTAYVRCADVDGNAMASSYVVSYGIDSVAPSVNVTDPLDSSTLAAAPTSVTGASSDGGSGLDSTSVTFREIEDPYLIWTFCTDNPIAYMWLEDASPFPGCLNRYGPVTGSSASGSWTITTVPNTDGHFPPTTSLTEGRVYEIIATATDVAGNTAQQVVSYTYNVPPTIDAIVSVAGDTIAPYWDWTDDLSTTVVLTASDNVGVTECRGDAEQSWFEDMGYGCSFAGGQWTCAVGNVPGNGPRAIHLACADASSNYSDTEIVALTVDDAGPGTILWSDQTFGTSVDLNWAAADYSSGIGLANTYDVQYREGTSGTWTDCQTSYGSTTLTFPGGCSSPSPLTPGATYFFRTRGYDTHGNVAAFRTDDAVPVAVHTGSQAISSATSDESGGVLVTWIDDRDGSTSVYAQRLDADGHPLWNANGVAVCSGSHTVDGPVVVPDGSGGAIVAWSDERSGPSDIYAQRISSAGSAVWAANGVVVSDASGIQYKVRAVSDGSGGAIFSWDDNRSSNWDIYAQRLAPANGAPVWTANGVVVSNATAGQQNSQIVPDGSGGAIVAWVDARNANNDIYAQRLAPANGAPLWTANGVAVSTASGSQSTVALARHVSGGAVLAWNDARGASTDIYAQRLAPANGAPLWTTDGVPVVTAASSQSISSSSIIVSAATGIVVAWGDYRSGVTSDIYAQNLGSDDGAQLWTADGVAVSTASGQQYSPVLSPFGETGDVLITWRDYRELRWYGDLYGQRLSSAGDTQWTANGRPLTPIPSGLNRGVGLASFLVATSDASVIAVWSDSLSGHGTDVLAQRYDTAATGRWAQWQSVHDGASPTVEISSPEDGIYVNDTPNIEGTAVDDISGVDTVEVLLSCDGFKGSCAGSGATLYWSGAEWGSKNFPLQLHCSGCGTLNASWVTGSLPPVESLIDAEEYTVSATAADVVGNLSSPKTATFTADFSPPVISAITSVGGDATSPYLDPYDDGETRILFDVTDAGSGVAGCRWKGTTDFTSYLDPASYACTAPGDCTVTLAGQGVKTVYLRCTDVLDNAMGTSTVVSYTLPGKPAVTVLTGPSSYSSSAGTIALSWLSETFGGSPVSTYTLQYRAGLAGSWVSCRENTMVTAATFPTTCFSPPTIVPGTTYYFQVIAKSADGAVEQYRDFDGTPVARQKDLQVDPRIVPDGSGGTLVTWTDYRDATTTNGDVYVQRLDRTGNSRWTSNGVRLTNRLVDEWGSDVVGDGTGGAIVTWYDEEGVYVQRVDASGTPLWAANGVNLSTGLETFTPKILSDDAGGAYVVWIGDDPTDDVALRIQRVRSDGAAYWAAGGIILSPLNVNVQDPVLTSDGSSGAIVAWQDSRYGNWDIFAQRVDPTGTTKWTANGVAVAVTTGDQTGASIAPAGNRGQVVIAWQDLRGMDLDIYAQRISSTGSPVWVANGVSVTTAMGGQSQPLVSACGLFNCVAWNENGSGAPNDVYAQRLDGSGNRLWEVGGVPVATGGATQYLASITSAGLSGVYVTWTDYSAPQTARAQLLDFSGLAQWVAEGVVLSEARAATAATSTVADGDLTVTLTDDRSLRDWDVVAQRLDATGVRQWGHRTVPDDTVAPTVTVVSVAGDTAASYYDAANDGQTDLLLDADDATSDLESCRYSASPPLIYGDMTGCGAFSLAGQTTCALGSLAEGSYAYTYACRDAIGNTSSLSATVPFMVDWTGPVGPTITYGSSFQNTTPIALTVDDGTDAVSGVNPASRFVQASSCVMAGIACDPVGAYGSVVVSGTYPNLMYTGAVVGSCYQFQYLVSDNAGNQSLALSGNTQCIETDPPTGGSVSSYQGLQSSPSVTVTVNRGTDALSGMSPNDGDYLLEVAQAALTDGTCESFLAYADAGVTEVATATSYTYTAPSGYCLTFRYTVKDVAGNSATWTGTDVTKVDSSTPDIVAVDAGASAADRTTLTSGVVFGPPAIGGDGLASFSWTDPSSPSGNLAYSTLTSSASSPFDDEYLVGYWDFDEELVIPDRSVAGNHVTSIAGTTYVTGAGARQGAARQFTVSTDVLTVPDSASLDLEDAVTVEFWMYPSSNTSNGNTLFLRKSAVGAENLQFFLYGANHASTPNVINVYASRGGVWGNTCIPKQLPALDTWYHVVWAYDSVTGGVLYVNGVPTAAPYSSGLLATNDEPLLIQTSTNDIDVTIDELRISHRALGAAEAAARAGIVATATPYRDDVALTEGARYMHVLPRTNAGTYGADRSFAVLYDATPPTGGSVTNPNGTHPFMGVPVTVNRGTDAFSGMSSTNGDYSLEVAQATFSGGACGSFGAYVDAGVEEVAAATSYVFIATPGTCVKFRYTVKDAVGNAATWTGAVVTMVDTELPDVVAVDAGASAADRTSLTSGVAFGAAAIGGDGLASFSWTDPSSLSDDLFLTVYNASSSPAFDDEYLVGYWDFDQEFTFPDLSKNGNHGVAVGTSYYVTGASARQGAAREFTAAFVRVVVPDAPSLDLTNDVTVEFWLYPKTNTLSGGSNLIEKMEAANVVTSNFRITLNGEASPTYPNRLSCFANRGGDWGYVCTPYTLPALNTWYHIVWTYNSTTGGILYVNGVQTGAPFSSGLLATNDVNVQIGTGTNLMSAVFDEVRIYHRVLGATEIATRAGIVATATPYLDEVALTEGARYMHVLAKSGAGGSGTERTFTAIYDGTPPTVTGVSSSLANGAYRQSQVVPIQVTFSEPVTVTGTPTLTLATGTPAATSVSYTSGSGTATLTFTYTVAAGNESPDLDYVATTSLSASGGTIRDTALNDATLTLASPGAAGSLGANTNLVIDTTPPAGGSVASYNGTQASTTVTVSVDRGTDALSGMSSNDADYLLYVQQATLASGVCGMFGPPVDAGLIEVATATSYEYAAASGYCYSFTYAVKDVAGNLQYYSGADVTRVDSTTPDIVAVDAGSGTDVPPVDRTSLASGVVFDAAALGGDGLASFSWTDPDSVSGDIFIGARSTSASTAFDDTNLVGFWDFDEEYVFPDRSGNGNDGTVSGSTFVADGKHGGARQFEAGNLLTVPDSTSLDIANDVTIEFWIEPKSNSEPDESVILQKATSTSDAMVRVSLTGSLHASPKQLSVSANRGGTWGSVSPSYTFPSYDTWYHVVWTFNSAAGGKLYIDGVQQGAAVGSGALATNDAPLSVGSNPYNTNFIIDELRISHRVLGALEVAVRASMVGATTPYVDEISIPSGVSYFHVRPKTYAGVHGTVRTFELRFDEDAPVVDILLPVNGSVVTAAPAASGTASDATGVVASVTTYLLCQSTVAADTGGASDCSVTVGSYNHYWNGTRWTLTPTPLAVSCTGCGTASATWSTTTTLPSAASLANNVPYIYDAQATDSVGHDSDHDAHVWTYRPAITLTVNSTGTPTLFTPGGADQVWSTSLTVETPSSGGFTLAAKRTTAGYASLAGATISQNGQLNTFDAAGTKDGSTTTQGWTVTNSPSGAAVLIDFGTPVTLSGLRIYADSAGFSTYFGTDVSADGVSYAPFGGGLIRPNVQGWTAKTFTVPGTYRYWRIRNVTANSSTVAFTELQFSAGGVSTLLNTLDSSTPIPDYADWNQASPNGATYGADGLGFRVSCTGTTGGYGGPNYAPTWWGTSGASQCGTAANQADNLATALYAGFPTADQIIAQNTQYNAVAQDFQVDYRLKVSASQASGTYTGTVLYTAATTP